MKKHTKVYIDHFYWGDSSEIYCEICLEWEGDYRKAQDVHHIGGRGSGGSKLLDIPEKLMALCRSCHQQCEEGFIDDETQIETHLQFAEGNETPIDEEIARKSLHQLTQMYKDGH